MTTASKDLSPSLVAAAAKAVRSAYCEQRSLFEARVTGRVAPYRSGVAWDGGRDQQGRQRKPVWPTIATKMLTAGLLLPDIPDFVQWAFGELGGVSAAPFPPELARPALLSSFLANRKHGVTEEEVRLAREAQSRHFEEAVLLLQSAEYAAGWTRESIYQHVLLDVHLPISALFRCAIARQLGLSKVVEVFREPARKQFARHPDLYRRVWHDLLQAPPPEGSVKSRV